MGDKTSDRSDHTRRAYSVHSSAAGPVLEGYHASESDDFCIRAKSEKEALELIGRFSGLSAYFTTLREERAGALRCTAWYIVVCDKGVYVQGSLGPVHDRSNDRALVPRETAAPDNPVAVDAGRSATLDSPDACGSDPRVPDWELLPFQFARIPSLAETLHSLKDEAGRRVLSPSQLPLFDALEHGDFEDCWDVERIRRESEKRRRP